MISPSCEPARRVAYGTVLASVLLLPLGCGESRGELTGTVTYQGKQVVFGSVLVAMSDGLVVSSPVSADGTYRIQDLRPGMVQIAVSSPDPAQPASQPRVKSDAPAQTKEKSGWFTIPERFADFNTSGLEFMINAGANRYAIELK